MRSRFQIISPFQNLYVCVRSQAAVNDHSQEKKKKKTAKESSVRRGVNELMTSRLRLYPNGNGGTNNEYTPLYYTILSHYTMEHPLFVLSRLHLATIRGP